MRFRFTAKWLLVLPACLLHREPVAPALPSVEATVQVPARPSEAEAPPEPALAHPECTLEDESLRRLLSAVPAQNLDLAAARARVAQARALADQAFARFLPTVDLQASVSRQQLVIPFPSGAIPGGAGGSQLLSLSFNSYAASIPVAWELDVWGGIGANWRAAKAERASAEAQVDALALSLIAQAAEAWLARAEQQTIQAVLEDQIRTGESLLELVSARFGLGQVSALDLTEQRTQLENLRAGLPLIAASGEVSSNQLAVLLGLTDVSELPEAPSRLPALPPPVSAVPLETLLERPDLAAARWQLAAADHRVAAAIGDRLPAFSVTAGFGYESQSLETFFDVTTWNVGAALGVPLTDGGRRRAEVRRTEAVVEEAAAVYRATWLTAVQEVRDALFQENRYRARLEALEKARKAAADAFDVASSRYRAGLVDYLRVLSALQSRQASERELVSVRRQILSQRVQLCRALASSPVPLRSTP